MRPHFIKAVPIVQALEGRAAVSVIHTGQHYDYELTGAHTQSSGLPDPDTVFDVGTGSPHSQVGVGVMRLEPELRVLRPDLVVVVGDANSSLIGALAAAQLGLPVCHVEAGVRKERGSWTLEEANRRLIDSVASLCLTPTKTKQHDLERALRKGSRQIARFTGDVLLDSAQRTAGVTAARDLPGWAASLVPQADVVVTFHRAETLQDDQLVREIADRLMACSLQVDLILHPRTARRLAALGLMAELESSKGVTVSAACPHDEMVRRIATAGVVLTDSSGVQRESYFMGKPCVVLRDDTEYHEATIGGAGVIAGLSMERAEAALHDLRGRGFVPDHEEFGSGSAATRIADEITNFLQLIGQR